MVATEVVSICDRSDVPAERIMSMHWICTLKPTENPGSAQCAQARMVVRRYTDLDLTSVRSEAATISRLGRQRLLLVCAYHYWNFYTSDVKTGFPQRSKEAESARNICCDHQPER